MPARVGDLRNRRFTAAERWKMFLQRFRRRLGIRTFLCDSCRYDHDSVCAHPRRPNVLVCPDHRRR